MLLPPDTVSCRPYPTSAPQLPRSPLTLTDSSSPLLWQPILLFHSTFRYCNCLCNYLLNVCLSSIFQFLRVGCVSFFFNFQISITLHSPRDMVGIHQEHIRLPCVSNGYVTMNQFSCSFFSNQTS